MKKFYSLIGALLLSTVAFGATFNLFSPASGVLKGNPSTYVTTSATSLDIKTLWTGTCDNTTYLRGDGTCATPPGTGGGTVNSVALSAPSVFGVSGSPVTSTGTLALSFATGQTANSFLATPDGTTGALSLRTIVNGDLPTVNVAHGGTGAVTLTGPLKGNGTSAFSAALAADIYGLWSGTCSSSTFLRGDGACAAGNAGTVTSVGLTVPSGFSVTGSPVTTSGTLAISGTLNPSAGGTGVATLTGIAKGNGTSAFTAAVSGDVISTWGGTCDATTYLRGDGSCVTPPSGGTSANPSATIGLTAVNGSAGTFLRSDGAPALSQAIAPTWTGVHTFSGTGSRISLTGGGTSSSRIDWANTGGTLWAGVDNSGGGAVISGGSAYGAVLATTGATALTLGTNGAARMPISSAGNVTINAPSSGTPLTANRGTAGIVAAFTGPSQSAYIYTDTSSAYFASDASANTSIQLNESSDFVSVYTAGVERTRVASAGNVTINAPSSGTALTTTATSTDYAAIFNGTARGVSIRAGSTTSDYPLIVDNGAASVDHFIINGVGAIAVNNGSYGTSGQVLTSSGSSAAPTWTTVASCTTGSFTGTATGMTGATTGTVNYRVCGNVAWLWTQGGAITGTSNTTSLTMTGLAAAVQPSHGHIVNCTPTDNSAIVMGMCSVSASTITVYSGNSSTGFTASGSKGFVNGWTVSYPLD